jgi:hypothetical protein
MTWLLGIVVRLLRFPSSQPDQNGATATGRDE